MTSSIHAGSSIYNKHLVLNLPTRTWSYLTHSELSPPSAVLPMQTVRGGKYATYWLGKWRCHPTSTADFQKVDLIDINNMFHDHGPVAHVAIPTSTAYTETFVYPYSSHVVTHPLLGMGNFEPCRPRSAMLKHTLAISATATSTSSALNTTKIYVEDAEVTHTPIGSSLDTTAAGQQPEWWSGITTDTNRVADMSTASWQARGQWDVDGVTATARAISQVDKIMLDAIASTMTAPTIHYRDDYWWKDKDAEVYRYGAHILHGLALEIDDLENGSDR
jgi:hypothetical protein